MANDPNAEIQSVNDDVDVDQLSTDDLEDVSGGGCSGCHGIYTPDNQV